MSDPQHTSQFMKVKNQGRLVGVYSSKSIRGQIIVLTVLGVVLFAGGCAAWIFYIIDLYSQFGPAILQKILFWPLVSLTAFVILCSIIGISLLMLPQQSVGLFEHGIAYLDRKKFLPIRWEAVSSLNAKIRRDVFLGMTLKETSILNIRTWNSQMVTLTSRIRNLSDLTDRIEESVSPLILEKVTQALSDQQKVSFGTLQVNPEGLSFDQLIIPWKGLESYQIRNGVLFLKYVSGDKKQTRRIPTASLENIQILATILDKNIQNQPGN